MFKVGWSDPNFTQNSSKINWLTAARELNVTKIGGFKKKFYIPTIILDIFNKKMICWS